MTSLTSSYIQSVMSLAFPTLTLFTCSDAGECLCLDKEQPKHSKPAASATLHLPPQFYLNCWISWSHLVGHRPLLPNCVPSGGTRIVSTSLPLWYQGYKGLNLGTNKVYRCVEFMLHCFFFFLSQFQSSHKLKMHNKVYTITRKGCFN